jgi:hypothetical protein
MITSLLKIYAIKFFSGSNFNTERFLVYQIQDLVWTESVLLIIQSWTIICFIRICFFDKFHFDKTD